MDDQEKVNERMENIKELKFSIIEALKSGMSMYEYLNELLIFSEKQEEDTDAVVLSTVHGVKGLEFDSVFLLGMNEGKFPSNKVNNDIDELEEERRVAYVAITRAKKKLVLTNISYDYTGEY